jgi:hypothetical protein
MEQTIFIVMAIAPFSGLKPGAVVMRKKKSCTNSS